MVLGKLSVKIECPSLYERLTCDFKNANVQLIKGAIEKFNWEKSLEGKNVHDQIYSFNKIILNIFYNLIPY